MGLTNHHSDGMRLSRAHQPELNAKAPWVRPANETRQARRPKMRQVEVQGQPRADGSRRRSREEHPTNADVPCLELVIRRGEGGIVQFDSDGGIQRCTGVLSLLSQDEYGFR